MAKKHHETQAQCCELEQLRLVDGTVTDDSDAFAFGGRTVYKNIFNDRKFVEAYLLADAEKVKCQCVLDDKMENDREDVKQ